MAFAANPLSLTIPDAAFESWLRDTGYLEILDDRTSAPAPDPAPPPNLPRLAAADRRSVSTFFSFVAALRTLASLLALNPFAKLAADDFSGPTPSWAHHFLVGPGDGPSYSWPAGPSQLRMRVQENVRRYARNYAFLGVVVFACSLYKRPVSLLGLVVSLLMWELEKYCSRRWELEERFPNLRQLLVRVAQLATGMVLYLCNLQLTVFYALAVSYAVMLFHASLRKLTPSKQLSVASKHKRSQQQKMQYLIKSR